MRSSKPLIFSAGALVILAAGFILWTYAELNTEIRHSASGRYIKIEKGASPKQIVALLRSNGVIRSAFAIRVYLRTFGDPGKLKAGEYRFRSPISAMEVLKELEKGNERSVKLTIPEGWTRFEIADRIASKFHSDPPMDEKAVLGLMNETSLIRDFAPDASNLEGFLYPTTYKFPLNTSHEDVIKRMVRQFRTVWRPEWTAKATAMGRTPFEIVTIASLIENESRVDAERKVVASVIYNRLKRGMPLGIDATNVYIAKMLGKWDGTIHRSDIEINHPYNTRKITGLPPGPISNASESAFKAALGPARTDYLFYVRDVEKNDGSHHFYSSAASFEIGKAKYQKWLKEQRAGH